MRDLTPCGLDAPVAAGGTYVFAPQSQNGNGTGGQATCSPTVGSRYNHPTIDGATSGTVTCLYIRKDLAVAGSKVTQCQYDFGTHNGWNSHPWVASDCSFGVPDAGWTALGQGQNGNGTQGQVKWLFVSE